MEYDAAKRLSSVANLGLALAFFCPLKIKGFSFSENSVDISPPNPIILPCFSVNSLKKFAIRGRFLL